MTGMKALTAISAATVALLVPSCTRIIYNARALPADAPIANVVVNENDCTPVDTPLTTIPTDAGEPVLKIPQPPGWERVTMMDSELIRFTIRNDMLSANAVVTVESIYRTGDPDEAFDIMREGMFELLGADADLDVTRHLQCGLPAETIEYINPGAWETGPMAATSLAIIMLLDDRTHVVTVNVVSKKPEDPIYVLDTSAILTGFQMLAPASS